MRLVSSPLPQTQSAYPALAPPVRIRLVTTQPHACPYLPGRDAQNRAFLAERMPGEMYHDFMDAGFRRSGEVFYQPVCRGCRACVPIRVVVGRFVMSKSQRRCWRRNADVVVTTGAPGATDEKFDVYRRFVEQRFRAKGRSAPDAERPDFASFAAFLCQSPVDTIEFTYRDGAGRLLGVGICDACPRSLSSVYFYFDPAEARRGLGTFGALWEIDYARRANLPHYYLGYWVGGCPTMDYKRNLGACELLGTDGVWRDAGHVACPAGADGGPRVATDG
jgi:arginyl-tRNA--protein-N-Asp/Glu arginylyltransferase